MESRRSFLKKGSKLLVGIAVGGSLTHLLSGCHPIRYIQAEIREGALLVPREEFEGRNFVVIKYEGLKAPVYLNKKEDGSYNAFLMLCTHKACTLKPTGKFLTCPCHGSEFSNTGEVLRSPANKPLKPFEVETKGSNIIIYIS